MTVIAWDGKTLAADTQGETGWMKTHRTKIYRHGSVLMGGAGKWPVVCAMLEWVKRGRLAAEWPACATDEANSIVLVIDDEGIWIFESGPYSQPLEMSFFAIGGGAEAAMAAMALGFDAKRAVEVAIQVCKGCDGDITVLERDAQG